jgi:hypothetical protein
MAVVNFRQCRNGLTDRYIDIALVFVNYPANLLFVSATSTENIPIARHVKNASSSAPTTFTPRKSDKVSIARHTGHELCNECRSTKRLAGLNVNFAVRPCTLQIFTPT